MAATDAKIVIPDPSNPSNLIWQDVEKIWIMDSGVWKPVFKTNLLENPWKEGFKLKGSQMVLSSATTYTSNATYTVSTTSSQRVRFVKVVARGAGGGGGGGAPYYTFNAYTGALNYYSGVGGHGGNGGGATSDVYEVRPGNVLTIVVGQGGGAGAVSTSLHQNNTGGSAGGSGGSSYVSIGANAPNGVSTGTEIAKGTGGGGGQTNMANGSSGSGSFNTNNTQGEGTGSTHGGANGGIRGIVQYNFPSYVSQYPTAGSNGSVELYTYYLNNIP